MQIVVVYIKVVVVEGEISGKYNRDISKKENQKCLDDCVVFKGSGCINDMLDHVLSFKREAKKLILKLLNISYTW